MLTIHKPLRIAVLCSHRAPGLMYLLNRSPYIGIAYEIVCCVTTEDTFAEEVRVERRGIPTISHSIGKFYEARGTRRWRNLTARAGYDAETAAIVERYLPDVVLLDGYLYIVTAPLLNRFKNRILNLHFSDLADRAPDGAPNYPGIHAVRDALAGGRTETRATVHLVTSEPDAGPPIVRSWPFPVSPLVQDIRTLEAGDVFRAYAFAHEQWMMRTAAGPLLAAALRLVASGAVDADALAQTDAAHASAWTLDRQGRLVAPDVELTRAELVVV